MNLHNTAVQRDPVTGKILNVWTFEFEPKEWNAFAEKMRAAFDAGDVADKTKVLRALRGVLDSALTEVADRSLVVPVEHVTRAQYEDILRGPHHKVGK